MHSLTKSAIFYAPRPYPRRSRARSGSTGSGADGDLGAWLGFRSGRGRDCRMPPLGIFASEFLVVSSTFAPAAACIVLVFGLLLAFGALTLRLTASHWRTARQHSQTGVLRAVLRISRSFSGQGSASPAPLVVWFPRGSSSWIVGDQRDMPSPDRSDAGRPQRFRRSPWPRRG
jgi:hydrogenase-4 component F